MKTMSEKRNEVKNLSIEYLKKACEIFNTYRYSENLKPIIKTVIFDFSLKGTTAGMACKKSDIWKLRYNTELFENGHYKDILEEVVPHEVAYIVTYILFPSPKSHGKEWKMVMRSFGVSNPSATHKFKVSNTKRTKKYKYVCGYGCECTVGPKVHKNISIYGRTYRCKKHKSVIKYTGEMTYNK